ncbi:MAG: OmpH family outer membrane protein [Gemmatimonadaceae bacterium]|nr:OmpH family outer membrane protein [Gemmatimonadaceae bacterium]
MRFFIKSAAVAFMATMIVAGASSAQATATPKLGYINSSQILAEAPGRAEAEAQFEREVGAYRLQLQRMSDSLQQLDSVFQREAPRLDSITRVTRQKAIAERESNYQQRANALNQQMQNRQAELVRPIMEQLQKVLEVLRTEERYAMIFDVAAGSGSVVVSADKSLDITAKVLARLKTAGAPKATGSTLQQQPAGVTRK